jgi:hypothetical protein
MLLCAEIMRFTPLVLALAALAAPSFACSEGISTADDDVTVAPSPFWKNTLSFPNEPFAASGGSDEPRWVKFSIFVSDGIDDSTKVYFQDSNKFSFHFDFAKELLPGFAGMTPAQFSQATLKKQGQKLITGAVLMPPRLDTFEYGVQLIREDAYTREEVKALHDIVVSRINVEPGRTAKPFYMPTFEQNPTAQRERAFFETNGVAISSPERWLSGDACYSAGWAFGRARFIPGAEIKQAHLDGRLKTDDILVTDGIPAEVPYVAGIVSLAPSTPSSHVAILSKTWGIPFVFPIAEAMRTRLRGLAEKEIALRTIARTDDFGGTTCSLDIVEPASPIDAPTRAAIAALRRPPPVDLPVRSRLGALTKPTAALRPRDAKHFGGKASNFGTLRRAVPNNSPNALGVSFDLWEAFIAQRLATGKTLAEEIDARLSGLAFPPDVRVLEPRLEEIRNLVTEVAALPAVERGKLFAELQAFGFDPKVKLRFRSSTNVEDGAVLSGAGLYDSFSGCLADDLDGDAAGPSACDPAEPKEKGAERAIKKVFASFFNTNAVIERLKYGIKESDVGMALAVHPSFPDEREAANGVITAQLNSFSTTIEIVSQLGAESVTNPSGGALPESVTARIFFGGDPFLSFRQGSTRVQLGGKVMKWEDDYLALARLVDKASAAFKAEHGAPQEISIDIEFKKDTSGALILKQIRQIPERSRTPSVVPVLLDEASTLCTFQGEFGSVLANHRLKVRGGLAMRNTALSDAAVASPIVRKLDLTVVDSGARVSQAGDPRALPGARHTLNGDLITDAWTFGSKTLRVSAEVKRLVAPAETPLTVARDYVWHFGATYGVPVPAFLADDRVGSTREDNVMLERCAGEADVAPAPQTIDERGPNGLRVKATYRYWKPQGGFEKTASLATWEGTTITGLISKPIVLKGWWSQSFRPGHHNFDEDFMFEPGLEENLPADVAAELAAKDIQALVLLHAERVSLGRNARFFVLRKSTQKLEPL